MLFFLYDLIQLLGALVFLPKLLWNRSTERIKAYLGFSLPSQRQKGRAFLIYAVSVGEVKALAALFHKMKESYPDATFYIASRTETGLAEAKRSLSKADHHFLLPFDFSWVTRSLLKRIKPDALIVVEGDLWFNLLRLTKKRGSLVFLVSGKISLRSYKRFLRVPSLAKRIFSLFDLICAQTPAFQERFISLGAPNVINTGNIKLGAKLKLLSPSEEKSFKKELGIEEGDFTIVIGSTHAPEEEKLLRALTPLLDRHPHCKILLVPRHPERFSQVEQILRRSGLSFATYLSKKSKTGKERVTLMNVMGKLTSLYQISDVAITAGSFDEKLRGHNILEPLLAHTPVLFGPYMSDQKELVDLVLSFDAGKQVSLSELSSLLESFLLDRENLSSLQQKGEALLAQVEGSISHTWEPLYALINTKAY